MPSYATSTMEDDPFEADGHAIARCSSFSLDFAGVLEAVAEGAFHHQICEYLQRADGEHQSGGVQENLQHAIRDGCFSAPAIHQPFHFLPADNTPLQPDVDVNTSSVELPENSFRPIQHDGSHVRNPVETKLFTVGERLLLPGSLQLWKMDQLQTADQSNRASFPSQHDALTSRRSFVYSGARADGQAGTIPGGAMPREISACASSSCSPTNIAASSKRFPPRLPQQANDVLSTGQERRVGKSKREPDQAGHIIRERLRRDDMTSKFLMLESLLPPGPKRDRATIVEHSIQHVKNLHHRKRDLQQKRIEMAKATRAFPSRLGLGAPVAQKTTAATHPLVIDKRKISRPNAIAKTTSGSLFEKVEVHFNLPQEIVVEMTCRSPHAHFQSRVLAALERLRMDVAKCSVSRARGLVLCSIVLQPREIFDPSLTSDDIARALKRAIYN